MTDQYSPAESLSELSDLNRLFLKFVRRRLREGLDCLGLPPAARAVLVAAPDALIERLACYPQALFRLDLDALSGHGVSETRRNDVDGSLRALQLILLTSSRNLGRQHPSAARLYLQLSADDLRSLAGLDFTELPALSRCPGIVRCAYSGVTWMWTELLKSRHPDRSRELILFGLQPTIELNQSAVMNR